MPRGGNAGGGGQPGWVLKCKGWETDPNAYIYFTIQGQNWANDLRRRSASRNGSTDPAYNTAKARQDKIFDIFAYIETWLADKTKWEAVDILRKYDIPCAPVMSMKDIADDPSLRASGTIVEVDHPVRGTYLTVGSPIKFSGHEGRDHVIAAAWRAHRTKSSAGLATTSRRSPGCMTSTPSDDVRNE